MADYWKSQDKKYCDFCKCWITDNKPSVEFHEKGRRHKENVSKRLRNIQRQSTRTHKETVRVDNAVKQMELAALEAYSKDVSNNADAALINNQVTTVASRKKLWQEFKSSDGKNYYQNVITNEIVWTPPSTGYTSLTDQKQQSYNAGKQQMKAVQKHNLVQERIRSGEHRKQQDEERARLFREKMKERRVEDIPMSQPAPIIPPGRSTPYGHWETVIERPIVPVDLQLPQQYPEYEAPVIEEVPLEPPPIEFKEKVVETLGSSGNVTFKKRKAAFSAKHNIRRRLDDE